MSVYPPTPSMSMMHGVGEKRKPKRPLNIGSAELTRQENEMLFALIGPDCVSLATAVVQLLKSDSSFWRIELAHGVVSLVKDYTQRAYFIRIYDILDEHVLWEFRLYKGFMVHSFPRCDKLLSFDQSERGDDGVVIGLNFYSSTEAAEFKDHLDRRHAQEQKSNSARTSTPKGLPIAMSTPG